ncbi:transposase [Devosia pacifica]|uniref:Transposase n=1 Tax=Devosia pacifica TaxID=1335967 RepID=A0A918SEY3_9HYPH|nr:IS66 family transposase [Devosia pacifica]GHA39453.1 transposase [Devosia pacifica]
MNPADLHELPDDVDALKAMIVATQAKVASAEQRRQALEAEIATHEAEIAQMKADKAADADRIGRLESIIAMLQRAQYGTRSEKLRIDPLDDEQMAFAFDELRTGLGEIEAKREKQSGQTASRPSRPRKAFAPHLERIEEVIEPEVPAECEGLEAVRIGEDVTERLDVTPAKFRVIVTRRPKYAYRLADGEDRIVQAPAPSHLIAGGIPTEAVLAQVAVSKYADGLPLYRQEEIYARDGVELDRSLMAQWMGRLSFELEPLAHHVLKTIKLGERIFADETRLPTLAPGTGKVKTAWLWAYARDDRTFGGSSPPMVAYRFEDSRSGECVARHLDGYCGILQVDGYAAYNRLGKTSGANDAMTLAGCWAHARRKFFDLHASDGSPFAGAVVTAMAPLWAIEDDIRGHDPDLRAAIRGEKSVPIVSNVLAMLDRELPRISGKSKLAEAIRYTLARRAVLERFLVDGRIEIDSNIVERAIRPQTITRKNSLFAGSDGGGRSWATIATLLTTAKMNGIDPHAWLTQTLELIANGWPNSDIDALMPWNYPG